MILVRAALDNISSVSVGSGLRRMCGMAFHLLENFNKWHNDSRYFIRWRGFFTSIFYTSLIVIWLCGTFLLIFSLPAQGGLLEKLIDVPDKEKPILEASVEYFINDFLIPMCKEKNVTCSMIVKRDVRRAFRIYYQRNISTVDNFIKDVNLFFRVDPGIVSLVQNPLAKSGDLKGFTYPNAFDFGKEPQTFFKEAKSIVFAQDTIKKLENIYIEKNSGFERNKKLFLDKIFQDTNLKHHQVSGVLEKFLSVITEADLSDNTTKTK